MSVGNEVYVLFASFTSTSSKPGMLGDLAPEEGPYVLRLARNLLFEANTPYSRRRAALRCPAVHC